MKLASVLVLFFCISLVSSISICIDNEPPSVPGGLSVSGSIGNILLEWQPSVDEPSCSGIGEYVIFRNEVELVRVSSDTLSFIDDEMLSVGEYDYSVHAIDLVGKNAGASVKNIISVSVTGSVGGGFYYSSFECSVNWTCGDWGECINEIEMRTCVDSNSCDTQNLKPNTLRECYIEINLGGEDGSQVEQSGQENSDIFSFITGGAIGVVSRSILVAFLFVGLAVILYFFVKRRAKLEKKSAKKSSKKNIKKTAKAK